MIDLATARRTREDRRETALLVLFSGVLGKPLARRELTAEQWAAREARAEQRREKRRELRREYPATATGTDR